MSSIHKILLVDDDVLSVESLKLLLESIIPKEYLLESIYTGTNVVESIMNNSYEIIFLDNILPDRDGISILEEINRKNIKAKIIFLTGLNDEELIERAFKLGALEVLPKGNIEISRLIDIVKKHLK